MKPADHLQQISDEDVFVAIQYLDPDFENYHGFRRPAPEISTGKAERAFLVVFVLGILLCFAALKYLQLI